MFYEKVEDLSATYQTLFAVCRSDVWCLRSERGAEKAPPPPTRIEPFIVRPYNRVNPRDAGGGIKLPPLTFCRISLKPDELRTFNLAYFKWPPGHLPRGEGGILLPPYVFLNIFEIPGCINTKFSTQQDEYLGHMCTKFCVYQMSGQVTARSEVQ